MPKLTFYPIARGLMLHHSTSRKRDKKIMFDFPASVTPTTRTIALRHCRRKNREDLDDANCDITRHERWSWSRAERVTAL